MQKLLKVKPTHVDTNTAAGRMKNDSALYLKNYRSNFNKNQTGQEGGNFDVGTPIQSNGQIVTVNLPAGINHTVGRKEWEPTNELYFMNWNSNGYHGIYRINGDDLTCDLIKVDPDLNFSIDPKYYITPDRITLKVIYVTNEAGDKVVFEKILLFTDGNNWQYWINTQAAIATNGFDSSAFPYYKPVYPHFDPTELIQYASRPPMFPAAIKEVPYVDADAGKENSLLDKSTQIAYRYIYTDGRVTALSAYSEPYYLKKSACNITNKGLPRCLTLTLYAGGPNVEKIQILRRNCNNDWVLYDTIDKYTTCDENSPDVINGQYWKRVKPFDGYAYNNIDNTIEYNYCGDKECTPFDNSSTGDTFFQTSLPLKSFAMADAGDAILLTNNLKFYNNFDCATLDNLQINVTPPSANTQDSCSPKTVKISVYAYIKDGTGNNQMVYQHGENTDILFGSIQYDGPGAFPASGTTGLRFFEQKAAALRCNLGTKKGFIGYLCGTNNYAISKQYSVDASGNLTEYGIIDSSSEGQVNAALTIVKANGYFVQRWDFVVPAGNYIFRLASHRASVTDDFVKTSTYFVGSLPRPVGLNARVQFSPSNLEKEIEINACAGDVDLWTDQGKPLINIYTPYIPQDSNWRFIDGYFTETEDNGIGVERTNYHMRLGNTNSKADGVFTDANGFFFAYSFGDGANRSEVIFGYYYGCTYQFGRAQSHVGQQGVSGPFFDQNTTEKLAEFGRLDKNGRILIRGKITDCDTGGGISGVAITFTGSGTYFSDGDGNYEVILHADQSGQRSGKLYYNAAGCLFISCDCSCVAPVVIPTTSLSCQTNTDRIYPSAINMSFKAISSVERGQKGGGRYGVAVVGWDDAERAGYANLISYEDIPTFMETGIYEPSKLTWEAIGELNLPPWVKSISFFITRNLNFKSYIQWVGDSIEYLDTTGSVVADGSGAIRARITIQSLLDFNTENNFATTTGYQFTPGDRVRFYDDGNGNLFPPDPVTGFMDYPILGTNFNETVQGQVAVSSTDETTGVTTTTTTPVTETNGKSFIIPYDSRLLELKDGCGFWIEIITPNDCVDVESYYEISEKYPVENGELMFNVTSGELKAFDTFYQNRNIQIANCPGKSLLHPFESSSVTDYWGKDCGNLGRITVKDPGVKQYWDETETTKSDEFVNNGRVNGIGTFRGKKSSFAGQQRGGVVATHVETQLMVFVCENDVFITSYNQKYVQAQADTGFVTVNLDDVIGQPQPKVGITHGCDPDDRATIIFEKELSFWLDRKNGVPVIFPYSQPQNISQQNSSWFLNKITHMINFNKGLSEDIRLANIIETCAGYDPKNNDYVLTFRPRNGLKNDPFYFVNNEREENIQQPETFAFSIDQKDWTDYKGYAAEFYGTLRSCISGKEFVSFAAGLPYFHNSILPKSAITFNEFYGIQTESVIEVSFNGSEDGLNDKVKTAQSITVKNNGDAFFIDRVITDNRKSFSYVPLVYFNKVNNVWYSTLLSDATTYPDPSHPVPSQLIDGKLMNGLYFKIRFVKDPNTLNKYFELDDFALRVSGVEKSDK